MPFEWSYLMGLALLACLTVAALLGWLAARLLVDATRPQQAHRPSPGGRMALPPDVGPT